MTKWEYKTFASNHAHHDTRLILDLNSYGREGWEMVGSGAEGTQTAFIFKRPIPEEKAVEAPAEAAHSERRPRYAVRSQLIGATQQFSNCFTIEGNDLKEMEDAYHEQVSLAIVQSAYLRDRVSKLVLKSYKRAQPEDAQPLEAAPDGLPREAVDAPAKGRKRYSLMIWYPWSCAVEQDTFDSVQEAEAAYARLGIHPYRMHRIVDRHEGQQKDEDLSKGRYLVFVIDQTAARGGWHNLLGRYHTLQEATDAAQRRVWSSWHIVDIEKDVIVAAPYMQLLQPGRA